MPDTTFFGGGEGFVKSFLLKAVETTFYQLLCNSGSVLQNRHQRPHIFYLLPAFICLLNHPTFLFFNKTLESEREKIKRMNQ